IPHNTSAHAAGHISPAFHTLPRSSFYSSFLHSFSIAAFPSLPLSVDTVRYIICIIANYWKKCNQMTEPVHTIIYEILKKIVASPLGYIRQRSKILW
ncbi:MAG: hypothetical protein K2P19_04745, partial [Kineothrix sp.]|nr:hypothetical protein [Kineothrix sp.]